MRKVFKFIFLLISLCNISFVYAKELETSVFYTNKYNVEFTKEEYNFLSQFYWEGCQDLMNKDDYERFIESNIMNGEIETVFLDPVSMYSSSISTTKKTLKISKSCSTNCAISVTATWKEMPVTRSYDVIGAYLENTSLVSTPVTSTVSSTQSDFSNEIMKHANGFGVSIKLPSSGSNVIVNQSYRVKTGGKVFASYQHARQTISLSDSKKYSIANSGYGGVFNFSGSAVDIYDRMRGVSINLNNSKSL